MSHFSFGATNFEIKDASTIWILSAGPSLDFFNIKLIKPEHLVITINSVLSYYNKSDFQIGSDKTSVDGYYKYCEPNTIWFAKKYFLEFLKSKQIKAMCIDDLVDRIFKGSGSDAIMLCYFLTYYQPTIKIINYVGLDCTDIVYNGKRYYYSSLVEVLDFQKDQQLPQNWWKNKNFKCQLSNHNSYIAQNNNIVKNLNYIPDLKKKLISYSFMDFNKGIKPILPQNKFGVPTL